MKSVVYKHLIPFQEGFTINLKQGSKVIRIDVVDGNPYMWVLTPLDDQCVHRPTVNKTNNAVLRTFIKITFTRDDFNAVGNAWNYKLPHIKPNKRRNECRNHGVL